MGRAQLAYDMLNYLNAALKEEPPAQPVIDPGKEVITEEKNDSVMENDNTELLNELTHELQDCEKCELSENRNSVVVGEGGVQAKIMVVGEGPGADEDAQGRPFVGASGQLLRSGFEKIGLAEQLLYITNVVKCRPPNNRDPKSDELKACRLFLDRQLELIDPPVILSLGNFGLRYFLGKDKNITTARGQVYEWEGRKVVPTFHPAFILRNRTRVQELVDDLQRAADQLK